MAENTSKSKANPQPEPVPDGHTRVQVVYHRDNTQHGKVIDVPHEEARDLVRENRVKVVDGSTPLGHPEPVDVEPGPATVPAPAAPVSTPPPGK